MFNLCLYYSLCWINYYNETITNTTNQLNEWFGLEFNNTFIYTDMYENLTIDEIKEYPNSCDIDLRWVCYGNGWSGGWASGKVCNQKSISGFQILKKKNRYTDEYYQELLNSYSIHEMGHELSMSHGPDTSNCSYGIMSYCSPEDYIWFFLDESLEEMYSYLNKSKCDEYL